MSRMIGWFVLLAMLFFCVSVRSDDVPATQPTTDEEKIEAWWNDLEKEDPEASRALLNMAQKPDLVIPFLKDHLTPLIINAEEARKLIADLGSDDEGVWKAAFDKLSYLDPRLAIDLETLMNENNDMPIRSRLVEILCDYPAETYAGKYISLHKFSKEKNYNFTNNKGSWWAEWNVAKLNKGGTSKKKWTRANRAIVLLEHFNTPEAVEIIKDMTSGHPEAQPTKSAQEALEFLEKNRH
ncbi:MAG TPA: hypothetical protein VF669_01445 [Tepidisphaeraceae bacterium]